MIEPDCEQIVDSLVDFSDGELPESEVARVEAHLGECAECQTRLEHLERSLTLAREVWQESAEAAAEVLSDAASKRPVPWQPVLAASLAAAVFVAMVAWHLTVGVRLGDDSGPSDGTTRDEKEMDQLIAEDLRNNAPVSRDEAAMAADLFAAIDRAGRRARLTASLALLAEEPNLEPFARDAEEYLAAAYGDTHSEDPVSPTGSHRIQEDEL